MAVAMSYFSLTVKMLCCVVLDARDFVGQSGHHCYATEEGAQV